MTSLSTEDSKSLETLHPCSSPSLALFCSDTFTIHKETLQTDKLKNYLLTQQLFIGKYIQ